MSKFVRPRRPAFALGWILVFASASSLWLPTTPRSWAQDEVTPAISTEELLQPGDPVPLNPEAEAPQGCFLVRMAEKLLPAGAFGMEDAPTDPALLPAWKAARLAKIERFKKIDSITDASLRNIRRFDADLKVMTNGLEATQNELLAMRNAKETIDVASYIWPNDETGLLYLNELKNAAERGVAIRIMIDGQGSMDKFHDAFKALNGLHVLDANGKPTAKLADVHVVEFNPLIRHPLALFEDMERSLENRFASPDERRAAFNDWRNRRAHNKVTIIDGHSHDHAVAVVQGRNKANEYTELPEKTARTYNDMSTMVRNGPDRDPNAANIGNTLGTYFDRLFYHHGNKTLEHQLPIPELNAKKDEAQFAAYAKAIETIKAKSPDFFPGLERMAQDGSDRTGYTRHAVRMTTQMRNIERRHALVEAQKSDRAWADRAYESNLAWSQINVRKAKHSIRIVSPYLDLTEAEITWIKNWLREDPTRTFEYISNSVASGDNMPAQALTDTVLGPTFMNDKSIAGQVKVMQFGRLDDKKYGGTQLYGKIHMKGIVIDQGTPDSRAVVGSDNWDWRSRNLNAEDGMHIEKPMVPVPGQTGTEAQMTIARRMDELAAQSYQFGTPEWQQVRDQHANRIKMLEERVMHGIEQASPAFTGTI